ncbi:MAG TPA: hypothetical protein ENN85_07890 [Methanoculleus sp.]|nr:hypothetical protein [Methanoculleus sp.]
MGFLNLFRGKKEKSELLLEKSKNRLKSSNNAVEPYSDRFQIPEDVKKLMWIADGKYKNYESEKNTKIFENELFRIEMSYLGVEEPSLIFSNLPIKPPSEEDYNTDIGYFPSYERLNPGTKWIYLDWLCNISNKIDTGYVFIFYYGLERHLIEGDYRNAFEMIFRLRQYHDNKSFLSYSRNALIMSSILHRDPENLEKVLSDFHEGEKCDNLLLVAKKLMRLDLTIDEIISLSSKVGFKNTRYIKNEPQLFRFHLSQLLISEFNKESFPFHELEFKLKNQTTLIFANYSLDNEIRNPNFPVIIENKEFAEIISKMLLVTHENVKKDLAEQRKMKKTESN